MLRVLLSIAFIATITTARAQAVNDVELKAAYCLGNVTARVAMLRGQAEAENDQFIKGGDLYAASRQQEESMRFRDYLAAKNLLGNESTKLAEDHGRADQKLCVEELKNPFYSNCIDKCSRLSDTQQSLACDNACPHPSSCERGYECSKNFLPF